jgi:hypothetical protein
VLKTFNSVVADGFSIESIGSFPPAMIIMRCRPNFAPLCSILELCEALAFASVQCLGFGAWAAAEAMAMSCVAWTWAAQGEDLQREMREAFDSLLQFMLVTICQCSLHQLAGAAPFVEWSKEASAAAARGDSEQVLVCVSFHHRLSLISLSTAEEVTPSVRVARVARARCGRVVLGSHSTVTRLRSH